MATDKDLYRVRDREERIKRILHLHKLGDLSRHIASRLGTTTSSVNEVLRAAGLEPHYPYDGLTVVTGGRKGAAVKSNDS